MTIVINEDTPIKDSLASYFLENKTGELAGRLSELKNHPGMSVRGPTPPPNQVSQDRNATVYLDTAKHIESFFSQELKGQKEFFNDTPYSVEAHGKDLLLTLNTNWSEAGSISSIAVAIIPFIIEYNLVKGASFSLNFVRYVRKNPAGLFRKIVDYLNEDFFFSLNKHHSHINKKMLESSAEKQIGEIEARDSLLSETLSSWQERLSASEQKAEATENLLKEQAEKLNFVGLSKAFGDLQSEKNSELSVATIWLFTIGIAMLATIGAVIFMNQSQVINVADLGDQVVKALEQGELKEAAMSTGKTASPPKLKVEASFSTEARIWQLLPVTALELVLLYFFRIYLQEYKSIKAQLLQIALRKSLCAFVHGYSEFADDIRKDKSGYDPLDKFETLVFSGITTEAGAIPTTFDGLESLGKVLGSIKPK